MLKININMNKCISVWVRVISRVKSVLVMFISSKKKYIIALCFITFKLDWLEFKKKTGNTLQFHLLTLVN